MSPGRGAHEADLCIGNFPMIKSFKTFIFSKDQNLILFVPCQVVERMKQIEVEEQEILRKEKELMSTVKLPAESESYRLETIAQGKRTQVIN